jgi:hypothetical protein
MHDLDQLFRQRVLDDVKDFETDSVYIPNPILTKKPSFALIGMEPSTSRKGVESVRRDAEAGYKGFLRSEEDFILHYCAYTFLCKGRFQYMITDLSKGAMAKNDADKNREGRYRTWSTLLKQELAHFGNPIAIAIGIGNHGQLNKLGFPVQHHVRHYSKQNSKYFNTQAPKDWEDDTAHTRELRDFAGTLLEHEAVDYTNDMRKRTLEKVFLKPLPRWKHGLLAHYTSEFSAIRENHPDA